MYLPCRASVAKCMLCFVVIDHITVLPSPQLWQVLTTKSPMPMYRLPSPLHAYLSYSLVCCLCLLDTT